MIELKEAQLDNGLRIVHHHDRSTAMVVVNILYNVGARDERAESTGIAHLFEHLMFGGSAHVPDYDQAIERAGGLNNAWTSNDFTSFYDLLPAQNAETAFWAESDRMAWLNLTADTLSVQQHVVIEEFKQQCLNRPYGDVSHHLRSMVYTRHPYRWPVIGLSPEHIANFTLEEAEEFYRRHYVPSNATLVVGGNITFERTMEYAKRWFGDIPAGKAATRAYVAEPEQNGAREKTVEASVPQTMITVAYPMSGFNEGSYILADTITDILSAGRSARLTKEVLNGTDLFTAIDSSITGSDEPGMLMVTGRLRDNSASTIDKARAAIASTLQRLVDTRVSDHELERTLNRSTSAFTFSNVSLLSRVQNIANYASRGIDINNVTSTYRRVVTPASIQSEAARLLTAERSNTLIYGPQQ